MISKKPPLNYKINLTRLAGGKQELEAQNILLVVIYEFSGGSRYLNI